MGACHGIHNVAELEEPEAESDEDDEVHNAVESEEESNGDWDVIPHLFEIVPGYEELFNLNPSTNESSESVCN